jgi:hypothetical protein
MRDVIRTRFVVVSSVGALALAGIVSACSSSSNPGGPAQGVDSGNEGDGAGSSSSGAGSGSSSGSSSGGSSSGSSVSDASSDALAETSTSAEAGCVDVTIKNFDTWCTVSVNGGAGTGAASIPNVCVPPNSAVTLVASPASGFELGPTPWVFLSGTGGTDAGTAGTIAGDGGVGSTSTVTLNVGTTPACALVCCPFTNGTGCNSAESGYTTFVTTGCE